MLRSLLRIFKFVKPYRTYTVLNFLLLASISIIALAIPNVIQHVIDDGILARNNQLITHYTLILLGLGGLSAILSFFQRYISQWVAAAVGYDVRNRLYNKIQHLPFSFHDHSQTGQLISRCIEDVRSIQEFAGNSIVEWAQLILYAVGVSYVILNQNLTLGLIALIPLLPLVYITVSFGNEVTRLFYRVDQALGSLSTTLQENVAGAQVVRAFAQEQTEMERFESFNKEYFSERMTLLTKFSHLFPSSQWLVTLSSIVILLFGGLMVLDGEITIGVLVSFNAYLILISAPTQQLTWLVNNSGEAAAGSQRVWEILDIVPEIRSKDNPVDPSSINGEVEFRNVTLTYYNETYASIDGISFLAKPKQVIALIGATGSGKSSIVNLIPRYYDVTAGEVLIDGVDVRDYELLGLRQNIGMVYQTSLLFSDSVFENIRYGKPEASLEDVINAAKAAQAHEFITAMPQGYDTVVGERGVTLSGGQRQRVAIARALLIDPKILILDDSLSAVDTKTEKLIQKALKELMKNRTTFVIAHRISSVKNADLILVLDNGKIVQKGKHSELVQEPGIYKDIFEHQLRTPESANSSVTLEGMA